MDYDDQWVIIMRIDAQGIFFRETDVGSDCSYDDLRKTEGYDVRNKYLPRVSPSSGRGEAPPKDTSDDDA